MSDTPALSAIHATAVVCGEAGVLIRGASGAGKSRLALALVAQCIALGRFARIVGDDRVRLTSANGHIIARPHPAIAGLVEEHGAGIMAVAHEPAALIRLIVDLIEPDSAGVAPARMPEVFETAEILLGVELPRMATIRQDNCDETARRVLARLQRDSA